MDDKEFIRLAELYKDSVFRLSYSYLGNKTDSDDAVQNTLIKLYTVKKKFETDEHIKNWLMKVAVNECRRIHKSVWRRTLPIEEAEIPEEWESEEQRELLEAVNSLEPNYRAIIYLYYFEGYKTEEIGRLTGKNSSTIRTRLQRAREKLRSRLMCDIPE